LEVTRSKIVALLIAVAYMACIVTAGGDDQIEVVLKGGFALAFILALIWFPEEIGSIKGYVGRGGYINRETPGCMVSAMGWLLLVGLPLGMWFFGG